MISDDVIYSQNGIGTSPASAQSHPRILIKNEVKEEFKRSAERVDWKQTIVENKRENLKPYLQLCSDQPDWLLSRLQMHWKTRHNQVYLVGGKFSYSDGKAPVPTVRYSGSRDWATDYETPKLEDIQPYFDDERGMYLQHKDNHQWEWVAPPKTGHIIENINEDVMRLVADAAFFYWLTGDVKYAKFATPVFFQYMEGMHYRNPPTQIDDSGQAGLSGLATFEVIHESIVISLALTYDFLYDYFIENKQDLTNAQAVFQKWGDQIIKNGVPNNNWNLFQARFLTYIAMVLEDDEYYDNGKGQQYYLKNTFEQSSERQIALKESVLVYDQSNGIWPESPSYSLHVTSTLLEILTLLDQLTNANELSNYPIVERASLAAFQYLFPSGYTVGFGDSNHRIITPKILELLLTNYHKYQLEEKKITITALLQQLIQKDLYQRTGLGLFELFFYVDQLSEVTSPLPQKPLVTPTFYAPNVSMFIQRLGKGEKAMMVSTVGSFGNHAHANGISIELFANSYVLGPDMGRGISYWNPDHREYYSQFPAHNTVVVDGISTYRPMRSYHPYTLDNCFPKSGETPLFEKVTLSKTSFQEPKTMSNQQRLTAQVLTNSQQGYVLDIFRSKKIKDTLQTHDYIYHNLGQSLQLFDKRNNLIEQKETNELGTAQGEQKAYDYFKEKKKANIDEDFTALFRLESNDHPDNNMKLWVKGQKAQQVFSVVGPKSRALSKGTAPEEILESQIPALVLRREQQAWKDPFVVLFNPYLDEQDNPIADVAFTNNDFGVQDITVSMTDGSRDFITIGSAESNFLEKEHFLQNGLASITRISDRAAVEFILVSGMNFYKGYGWEIISEGMPATVTIERKGNSFWIQNDQPVLLRIARTQDFVPGEMTIYKHGAISEVRKGKSSRFNSEQMEYRLAKACEKVVINQIE